MLKKITALLKRLPHNRIWFIILVILSCASIADVPGSPTFGMPSALQVLFILSVGCLKGAILIIVAAWMWRHKWLRVPAIAFFIIYALAAIINAGALAFYGFGFSRKLITVLAQTNRAEASEFLPDIYSHILITISSVKTWLWIAVAAVAAWLFCKISRKAAAVLTAGLSVVGVVMYGWLAINFNVGRTSVMMSLRIPKYFIEQRRTNLEMQKLIERKKPLPHPESVRSSKTATNVVVIIGESANRPNLSLYGFPLETSPYMDALADSLFVFTDALASSQITSSNIERILTFKPDDRVYGDWYNYPTLIDLFNAAGYRTYWLSNQERVGAWSNGAGVISATADVVSFIGLEYCEDALLVDKTLDDALLPPFYSAIADSADARMIFLHLLGSHNIYNKRYPPERAHFTADDVFQSIDRPWLNRDGVQLLADYSNSLVFTDSIWHETVVRVAESPDPSVVIYLSDHGEKVCEGNNIRGRDNRSVEIPFVIYANGAYRENNPAIIEKLSSAVQRPFSSAALVHMLMTLTDTQYNLYNGADDPLSDSFVARRRFVDEEPWPYDHNYDAESTD